MLRVENLNAWYGHSHVVQGISFTVEAGEIVTIMGLVAKRSGKAWFNGAEILAGPAHTRFRRGLGYVPEDRRIVPGLTVRENLRLGLLALAKGADEEALIGQVTRTFPRLKERLDQEGTSLSGGEQQMLAIARAMMSNPRMILLDEPSEGIMPILVDEMFKLFDDMKRAGTTILLVEQNVERALSISDRAYIMDHGVIVHHDTAAKLLTDKAIQERYCAV